MGKNLIKKLILPLAISFLSVLNLNAPLSETINIDEFYKTKREFYEKTINETFLNLNKIIYIPSFEKHGWNKWQTIKETLLSNTGNCIDKSVYEWNQLNKLGIPTQLVMGLFTDSSEDYHVWLEYIVGRDTFIIECSKEGHIYLRDSLPKNYYVPIKIDEARKEKLKKLEEKMGMKLDFKYYD